MTIRQSLQLMLTMLACAGALSSCSLNPSTTTPQPSANTGSTTVKAKKHNVPNKTSVAKPTFPKIVPSPASVKTGLKTQTILISKNTFSPATMTVKAGAIVQWLNKDSASHTVTSDTENGFKSSRLMKGQTYTHVFADVGTFKYHCLIHPNMTGTVTVK